MPYGPIHELSPQAWEKAAEWESSGALNPVLRPSDVYFGPDDKRPDPVAELREAGLVVRDGRIGDEVFDILPCLTVAAGLEYIADFRIDDRKFTALAASAGAGAALAVRERDLRVETDIIRVREIDGDELVKAMLDLLALDPGTGQLLGIHLSDARSHLGSVTEQPLSWEHKQLWAVLERPVVGPSIEVTIGVRDASGQRYSTDRRPLHIAQLDWGHFLNYSVGDGPDEMFFAGPATDENVHKALEALRGSLSTTV